MGLLKQFGQWISAKRKLRLYLLMILLAGGAIGLAVIFIFVNSRAAGTVSWGLGLFYALVIGHIGTGCFLNTLRKYMNHPDPPPVPGEEGVPTPLVGTIERLLFVTIIGVGIPMGQVMLGMGGWLAMKMAANWNRPTPITGEIDRKEALIRDTRRARGAFAALLASVVSLAFAAVGGGIALGKLNRQWLDAQFLSAG